jgi:FkbM family methyltransferase
MTVVQIGACVGSDHVQKMYESTTDGHFVIVEANPLHIDTLRSKYTDRATVVNVAVGGQIGEVDFFYSVDDGPGYEVASMSPEHILKHGYSRESLRSFKVPCLTLNELFDGLELGKIDIMFMDIEGAEMIALQSFDFERFDIPVIQVELLHINNAEFLQFMDAKGYVLTERSFDKDGYDRIFANKKHIKTTN